MTYPWSILDTETDRSGKFRVGVLLDDDGTVQASRELDEMRSIVLARAGRVVWGHNIAYDIGVLCAGAVGCRFMRGHFRSASFQGVRFLDTLSFFELPLSEAAPLCGGAKTGEGAESLDYDMAHLEEYCVDDCRATAAVVRCIERTADEIKASPVATGPGSWARSVLERLEPWTENYSDDRFFVRRGRTPQDAIRGGLVKCSVGEIRDGEKWDVKSAYPWQMWSGEFPHLPACRIGRADAGRVVLVEFWDARTESWVWGPPEEHEIIGGKVRRVVRCPKTQWGRPFRSFVEAMMETRERLKSTGDLGGAYLAKRVANSLSGVLGARTLTTYVKHGLVSGGQKTEFGLPGTRSAWAALVTGRQRARVLRAWKVAKVPAYSDTDSLVCKSYVPDGEGLPLFGRWELETRFDRAVILGPKMYATWLGDKSTGHVKGIPKRLAVPAVERLMMGKETVTEWDSVVTYRELPNAPALWTKRSRDPFRALKKAGFSSTLPRLEV